MKQSVEPRYIDAQGHFANSRYKHVRMPDFQEVSDEEERRTMYANRPIRVHNARLLDPEATLVKQGFQLVHQKTNVRDFLNLEVAKTDFYPECSELVKQLTGCTDTFVTQHQYRNGFGNLPEGHDRGSKPTPNGSPGNYGGTHSDISAYAENRWDEIVDGRHCAMFNLWRSIDLENNIQVMPLAVLDMTSLEPEDIIAADAWGGASAQQQHLVSLRLAFNEDHRWYYYPDMKPNELLIFKQYDTRAEDPCLRQVYHGAIHNPYAPEDAPLRHTIEVRVLALFDKEHDRESRKNRFQAAIPDHLPDGTLSQWAWR
ncbi:MAG: CmcJ/NvfI family oxidoreductase [Gammaproteobacteria bacterium]|nr:CmcJ/NvfI family oxidoreductase [Gammaproteobacteria bacterium]